MNSDLETLNSHLGKQNLKGRVVPVEHLDDLAVGDAFSLPGGHIAFPAIKKIPANWASQRLNIF
jgi:hypothetical protein